MGNMLPCLVQGAALPAMKPKQRMYSIRLVTMTLHKMKKRSSSCDKAKIASKSASGAEGVEVKSIKASSKASPRAAAHSGGHRKGVVRVKVVLTKEEAARLLTLTAKGQKTAAQIVAEMKKMEARRAANGAALAWRPALASIPEESS